MMRCVRERANETRRETSPQAGLRGDCGGRTRTFSMQLGAFPSLISARRFSAVALRRQVGGAGGGGEGGGGRGGGGEGGGGRGGGGEGGGGGE
jgi:hypothetical protein